MSGIITGALKILVGLAFASITLYVMVYMVLGTAIPLLNSVCYVPPSSTMSVSGPMQTGEYAVVIICAALAGICVVEGILDLIDEDEQDYYYGGRY